ncbi:MAG: PadR family transcriptional regulator [Bryobacteraceae bacterium]
MPIDNLQGSLEILVLKVLRRGAKNGYAIAAQIEQASDEVLRVEEGSLYPALHRLERRGWVESQWGPSEANRRAKYYRLTAQGRKQLQKETAAWRKMCEAIERVLNYRPAEA